MTTQSRRIPAASFRLPGDTLRQIKELTEILGMTKTGVLSRAVDRLYQQETQNMQTDQIYINRTQAVADCFDALLRGVDTPTIVQEEDGTASYIPGGFLNDISYAGSRQVVWSIQDASDLGDWNIEDEAERQEMASWVAAQHDWENIEDE